MEYQEFLRYVEKYIREYLPREYQKVNVQIAEFQMGGKQKKGLCLQLPEDEMMGRVIDLYPFYQNMSEKQVQLQECMGDVLKNCLKAFGSKENLRLPDLSYENIMDNLFVAVGNYEKMDLQNIPHRKVNDLAVIAKSQVDADHVITITKAVTEYFGMSANDIIDIATRRNAERTSPVFMNIEDMVTTLTLKEGENRTDEFGQREKNHLQVYVLTNTSGCYGAALIMDKDVLNRIADVFEKNLIILPSSVHELLIIPESKDIEIGYLKETVEAVNRTQVSQEDFLSDNIYLFDRKLKEIQMYADEQKTKRVCIQKRMDTIPFIKC